MGTSAASPSARTTAGSPSRPRCCWGDRDDGNLNVIGNFHVTANGVQLNPPSGSPTGVWSSNPQAVTYAPGANTVTIGLDWDDTTPSHNYNGQCKNGSNNPCQYHGTQPAHQAFVGTKGNAGAVVLVNNSATQVTGGLPGFPFDNHRSGGVRTDCSDADTCLDLPDGRHGERAQDRRLTTLRLDDPQANQTLQCDPDYAQGQEFSAFRYGCKPWYGANPFTNGDRGGTPTTKQCPDGGQWFSNNTMPAPFGKNSGGEPLALRSHRARHVDRPGRRRHRRRDRELREHQQQLVPAVRLQLRRQLRRQAGDGGPRPAARRHDSPNPAKLARPIPAS